jgi:hypothetical protein
MLPNLKYPLYQDGNHRKKKGDRPQQMDGESKRLMWSCQMGLQVCSELMRILLKHTPLHDIIIILGFSNYAHRLKDCF